MQTMPRIKNDVPSHDHKHLKIVPARLQHKRGKFFEASTIESVVYDS